MESGFGEERCRDLGSCSFSGFKTTPTALRAMQHVVFGAVMGDAAMLEAALERGVYALSVEGAGCC